MSSIVRSGPAAAEEAGAGADGAGGALLAGGAALAMASAVAGAVNVVVGAPPSTSLTVTGDAGGWPAQAKGLAANPRATAARRRDTERQDMSKTLHQPAGPPRRKREDA
jgi:hypothetical protein